MLEPFDHNLPYGTHAILCHGPPFATIQPITGSCMLPDAGILKFRLALPHSFDG